MSAIFWRSIKQIKMREGNKRREQSWEGWPVLRDLYVEERTLYLILSFTLSQWKDCGIGVVWWNLGVLVTAQQQQQQRRIADKVVLYVHILIIIL